MSNKARLSIVIEDSVKDELRLVAAEEKLNVTDFTRLLIEEALQARKLDNRIDIRRGLSGHGGTREKGQGDE